MQGAEEEADATKEPCGGEEKVAPGKPNVVMLHKNGEISQKIAEGGWRRELSRKNLLAVVGDSIEARLEGVKFVTEKMIDEPGVAHDDDEGSEEAEGNPPRFEAAPRFTEAQGEGQGGRRVAHGRCARGEGAKATRQSLLQ